MSLIRTSGASASAEASVERSASAKGSVERSASAKASADKSAGQAGAVRGLSVDCSPATDVAVAAQLACLLEASVAKPGNVSPDRSFADLRYEDFLAGAAAIGAPLAAAGSRPLGLTIRAAIAETARWTRSNTNLGIVLLLAPLAKAAVRRKADTTTGDVTTPQDVVSGFSRTTPADVMSGFSPSLRDEARRVLAATTVDDARDVYAAIRLAAPGGLGRVGDQDIADEPTQTLLEVMRLAAGRDGIAHEYATAYELTFLTGVPALERALGDGLARPDAIVETFLTLLAATPDTHIARRGGAAMAAEVSRQARTTIAAGGVRSADGRDAIERMDRGLRDPRHLGNPGTTADLTAAVIFVALLGGRWRP
jgi:triphosphoribosyl-dephospho-CoA synthase